MNIYLDFLFLVFLLLLNLLLIFSLLALDLRHFLLQKLVARVFEVQLLLQLLLDFDQLLIRLLLDFLVFLREFGQLLFRFLLKLLLQSNLRFHARSKLQWKSTSFSHC